MSMRAIAFKTAFEVYYRRKGLREPNLWQFLKESQWWSAGELRNYQNKKLRQQIEYVYTHVPYYRSIMDEWGLKPKDIETTDDLIKFPISTKETLKKNWDKFIPDQAKFSKTKIRITGGSTGEPLRIMNDYSNIAWEAALFWRGLEFSEYKLGDAMIKLFGGTLSLSTNSYRKKLTSKLLNLTSLPAFEISQDTISDYAGKIRKSKSKFMRGYTSAIYLLAKLISDSKSKIAMHGVFPTAETLFENQRKFIENVFQCEVFNQYGCGECNSIACECSSHNGLHVSDEHVFLEAIKDNKRVSDGEMGAATLTNFHNRAMPLIRYQNGDVISMKREPCSCGRGLSRISQIYGRTNDLLLTTDGRLISATFLPSICVNIDLNGIQQFQVIQEAKDIIRIKIVKTPGFVADELRPLFKVLRRYLGDVKIEVEYVASIPSTSQGKRKFVISELANNLLHMEDIT